MRGFKGLATDYRLRGFEWPAVSMAIYENKTTIILKTSLQLFCAIRSLSLAGMVNIIKDETD